MHAHARAESERRLLSIVDRERLTRVLKIMLDEKEFLSPYGIRALSRLTATIRTSCTSTGRRPPRRLRAGRIVERPVRRQLQLARTGVVSGQLTCSIEALQRFHHYFGDELKVECPTGSGVFMTLQEVATELSQRLTRIFLKDAAGRRPVAGGGALPERSALGRLRAVPRVLPWRQRRRARRKPSDRLDRPGREAAAAERPEGGTPPQGREGCRGNGGS